MVVEVEEPNAIDTMLYVYSELNSLLLSCCVKNIVSFFDNPLWNLVLTFLCHCLHSTLFCSPVISIL